MRIYLSGLMGSGKSTVAKALGELSSLPVIDLDAAIEANTGVSVSEIFRTRGEAAFRALESETLERLIERHPECVIALGGGAVTDKRLRRHLLSTGLLVTLDASDDALLQRVERGQGRPLLVGADDIAARLASLRERRAGAYAECHLRLDTTVVSPGAAAALVWQAAAQPPIVVPLGTRTYRIAVGVGIRSRLASQIVDEERVTHVLLVSDTTVGPLWADELARSLDAAGARVTEVRLPPGESAKNLSTVDAIWNAALSGGVDRRSMVLGVGGGVIGDMSGFAAATLLRGIRIGHIPTTLLAMVDSAIGGKTGFDTPHGKNLIGAIHQPSLVLSDVEVLATLSLAERRAGLAEVVKSAWIDGEDAVAELERDADALVAGEAAATLRAIRMAARLKARIVGEDEHESGLRAVLNLGHTLGHAIEASLGYDGIRHGEAVSLGMVAAFGVSERLGRVDRVERERMVELLSKLGLPIGVSAYRNDQVFSFLGSDKKRVRGTLGYVLPGVPGQVAQLSLPLSELITLLREP